MHFTPLPLKLNHWVKTIFHPDVVNVFLLARFISKLILLRNSTVGSLTSNLFRKIRHFFYCSLLASLLCPSLPCYYIEVTRRVLCSYQRKVRCPTTRRWMSPLENLRSLALLVLWYAGLCCFVTIHIVIVSVEPSYLSAEQQRASHRRFDAASYNELAVRSGYMMPR